MNAPPGTKRTVHFCLLSLYAITALCKAQERNQAPDKEIVVDILDANKTQYHEANFDTMAYEFGYEVGPNGQFHHENRGPDGVTYGCYGYIADDGNLQATHYVADARGYRIIVPGETVEIFESKPSDKKGPEGGEEEEEQNEVEDEGHENQRHFSPGKRVPYGELYFPKGCGGGKRDSPKPSSPYPSKPGVSQYPSTSGVQGQGSHYQPGAYQQPAYVSSQGKPAGVMGVQGSSHRPGVYPSGYQEQEKPGRPTGYQQPSYQEEGKPGSVTGVQGQGSHYQPGTYQQPSHPGSVTGVQGQGSHYRPGAYQQPSQPGSVTGVQGQGSHYRPGAYQHPSQPGQYAAHGKPETSPEGFPFKPGTFSTQPGSYVSHQKPGVGDIPFRSGTYQQGVYPDQEAGSSVSPLPSASYHQPSYSTPPAPYDQKDVPTVTKIPTKPGYVTYHPSYPGQKPAPEQHIYPGSQHQPSSPKYPSQHYSTGTQQQPGLSEKSGIPGLSPYTYPEKQTIPGKYVPPGKKEYPEQPSYPSQSGLSESYGQRLRPGEAKIPVKSQLPQQPEQPEVPEGADYAEPSSTQEQQAHPGGGYQDVQDYYPGSYPAPLQPDYGSKQQPGVSQQTEELPSPYVPPRQPGHYYASSTKGPGSRKPTVASQKYPYVSQPGKVQPKAGIPCDSEQLIPSGSSEAPQYAQPEELPVPETGSQEVEGAEATEPSYQPETTRHPKAPVPEYGVPYVHYIPQSPPPGPESAGQYSHVPSRGSTDYADLRFPHASTPVPSVVAPHGHKDEQPPVDHRVASASTPVSHVSSPKPARVTPTKSPVKGPTKSPLPLQSTISGYHKVSSSTVAPYTSVSIVTEEEEGAETTITPLPTEEPISSSTPSTKKPVATKKPATPSPGPIQQRIPISGEKSSAQPTVTPRPGPPKVSANKTTVSGSTPVPSARPPKPISTKKPLASSTEQPTSPSTAEEEEEVSGVPSEHTTPSHPAVTKAPAKSSSSSSVPSKKPGTKSLPVSSSTPEVVEGEEPDFSSTPLPAHSTPRTPPKVSTKAPPSKKPLQPSTKHPVTSTTMPITEEEEEVSPSELPVSTVSPITSSKGPGKSAAPPTKKPVQASTKRPVSSTVSEATEEEESTPTSTPVAHPATSPKAPGKSPAPPKKPVPPSTKRPITSTVSVVTEEEVSNPSETPTPLAYSTPAVPKPVNKTSPAPPGKKTQHPPAKQPVTPPVTESTEEPSSSTLEPEYSTPSKSPPKVTSTKKPVTTSKPSVQTRFPGDVPPKSPYPEVTRSPGKTPVPSSTPLPLSYSTPDAYSTASVYPDKPSKAPKPSSSRHPSVSVTPAGEARDVTQPPELSTKSPHDGSTRVPVHTKAPVDITPRKPYPGVSANITTVKPASSPHVTPSPLPTRSPVSQRMGAANATVPSSTAKSTPKGTKAPGKVSVKPASVKTSPSPTPTTTVITEAPETTTSAVTTIGTTTETEHETTIMTTEQPETTTGITSTGTEQPTTEPITVTTELLPTTTVTGQDEGTTQASQEEVTTLGPELPSESSPLPLSSPSPSDSIESASEQPHIDVRIPIPSVSSPKPKPSQADKPQFIAPQYQVIIVNASNVVPYSLPIASAPLSCPCYFMTKGDNGTQVQNVSTSTSAPPITHVLLLLFPVCPGNSTDQLKEVKPAFPTAVVLPYACDQCSNSSPGGDISKVSSQPVQHHASGPARKPSRVRVVRKRIQHALN